MERIDRASKPGMPRRLRHSYLLRIPDYGLVDLTIRIMRTKRWVRDQDADSPDWTVINFGPLVVVFRMEY